jgi:hypothetical protein
MMGDNWKENILVALGKSDTEILLVSADFANSGFIEEEELAHFLQHQQDKLILPVLARDYDFSYFEELSKRQFFKTKYRDYEGLKYNFDLANELMSFEYLIEPEPKAAIFINGYFKKLADFIHTAVVNKFFVL